MARERYVQSIHPWRGNPKGPDSEPALAWQAGGEASKKTGPTIARRQLLSDLLFVQVKGTEWPGHRDVEEVDGSAVRDRTDRVRDLFLSARWRGGPACPPSRSLGTRVTQRSGDSSRAAKWDASKKHR